MLVFSRTMGFRHKSIPQGIRAIKELGTGLFEVDATEDPTVFTADNLKKYKAVVFLSTTGDVLNPEQQTAFEGYIHAGGGYAGVHAAADTEYDWPWYGELMGAFFMGHPKIQQATVKVEDHTHRSTRSLPADWVRTDEWYAFKTNPRAKVHVLASLDEKTYDPGTTAMGDHPIAWYREFDGGRTWYTALGHTEESFAEPLFRTHLREGICWAAGLPDPGAAPAVRPAAPAPKASLLAQLPAQPLAPVLAAVPMSLTLAGVVLLAVIVVGSMGHGVRAPILAWLWPGLGHFALGYRQRGALAMVGVLGMFVTGVAVGGLDCVDSREDAPWFAAQAGNGPIAFGVDALNQGLLKTGRVGELMPTPTPLDPTGRPVAEPLQVSSYKGLGSANEFGTLFIALGGLMNLVLVMDCARREPADS
ncbi:MAG: ThuA domain-containing protein [Phycisphaerales bacterium]